MHNIKFNIQTTVIVDDFGSGIKDSIIEIKYLWPSPIYENWWLLAANGLDDVGKGD